MYCLFVYVYLHAYLDKGKWEFRTTSTPDIDLPSLNPDYDDYEYDHKTGMGFSITIFKLSIQKSTYLNYIYLASFILKRL